MASYHLSVKSISRSQGRSAVAAAAYRSGERLTDRRQGMEHDYTRKGGVEHTELVVPEGAPEWAHSRNLIWNAAEAAENRKNSVVAREWELALPAELDEAGRRELALDFAQTLVERYRVAADVCIHAPHREGDQRNHHAHVMTTTREIGSEGFGAKTRILDVKQTASVEVSAMRELWAERQNAALERAGEAERVDHRTLEAQRETAEAERDRLEEDLAARREVEARAERLNLPTDWVVDGRQSHEAIVADLGEAVDDRESDPDAWERVRDWQEIETELTRKTLEAAALDRPPEVKLGPRASAMERRAARAAESQGRVYEPVTDAGAQVHALREERSLFDAAIEGLEQARADLVRHVREAVSWVRDTVLGKDQERGPEPPSEAQGREAGRGSTVEDAATDASGRRQALLDRLKNIGRSDTGRDNPLDRDGGSEERDAPDRGASPEPLASAEEVQKHMRQIEDRNRAEAQDRMHRETRDRDSRSPERDRGRGMDR